MNVAEYLKLVENMKIDSDKVETVQNVYETKLPELLQKLYQMQKNLFFWIMM